MLKLQRELVANENGEAEYDFGFQTAVLVCERKSPRGERLMAEAVRNGYLTEKDIEKPSNLTENEQKTVRNEGKIPFQNLLLRNVYEAIRMNRKAKYSQLQDNLGVSESTILRAIKWLKDNGYINPERSKVKGEWQLL